MRLSLSALLIAAPFVYPAVVPFVAPSGHYHDSSALDCELKGQNVTINGVLTYMSLPPKGTYDPSVALLFLTDVFGLPSPDNLVLADEWAAAGFATYAPDYLNGDALPIDGIDDIDAWLVNHGEAQTDPPLLAVIDALKARGVEKFVASGYCFGGLYTTRLAQNNTIIVGTMAHPSFLAIPDDFETLKNQSRVPIEINSAEFDTGFTVPLAEVTDDVMVGQYAPGYLRRQFDGVAHGFAVRANASDPIQVAAKKGAFEMSLTWITSHL